MNNEQFYSNVAVLLNTTHDYLPFPFLRRTRWNQRRLGSGRFPNHGIVRCFGNNVHVALYDPELNVICSSKDAALELIKSAYAP